MSEVWPIVLAVLAGLVLWVLIAAVVGVLVGKCIALRDDRSRVSHSAHDRSRDAAEAGGADRLLR